jgi:hypothetical protein
MAIDAESLAQIEQIVTAAIGGRLREETRALAASLQQELGANTDALAIALRQEIGEQAVKLGERVEEVRQYSGVLYEDMARKFDLVLEGFEGLRQGQTSLRQIIGDESLELQSLVKLSYRQLQERVETLEQKSPDNREAPRPFRLKCPSFFVYSSPHPKSAHSMSSGRKD